MLNRCNVTLVFFRKLEYDTSISYHCTSCNFAFETYALLLDHEKQCVVVPPGIDDVKPFLTCPECHKTYATKRKLTNHLNHVHKRKVSRRLYCPECPKTFMKLDILNNHINKVHLGVAVYHECDICGAKLSTRMNMIYHKQAVHLKKFNVHCELCGKGYLFKGGLGAHKKRVHDREVTIISCPVEGCVKVFKTKPALKYHIQAVPCGKVFTHPFLYKKHLYRHENGQKSYYCYVCEKTLSSSGSYKIHIRTHTGEKPFVCDVCERGFNSTQRLKEHGVVHSKERSHVCTICEKKFAYHCTSCNFAFEIYAQLLDHENQCTVVPPSRDDIKSLPSCPECLRTYASKNSLSNHINRVHKHKESCWIYCPECPKIFKKVETLNTHINKVHRGIEKHHDCDICGAKLTTKIGLIYHKNALHLKKFNFHCELCGKGYMLKGLLDAHLRRIHDHESAIISCPVDGCVKVFKTKPAFKRHIQAVHAEDRPNLVCVPCGQAFTHSSLYEKHLRKHENDQSLYFCYICEKTLSCSGTYKTHLRTHTGEKPFVCKVCGRGFISMRSLKEHEIVVHTEELSHVCTVCGKRKLEFDISTNYHCTSCNFAFETYALLLDHESKCVFASTNGGGTKPLHSCPQCHKTFFYKRYVTNHINRVHKRDLSLKVSCPECPRTFSRANILNSHIDRVHRGIMESYECDICGVKLTTKLGMKEHKRHAHLKNFDFYCALCGKGFLYKARLDVHKRRVHEGEVTILPCSMEGCLKTFTSKYSLDYHIYAVHAKDRPELVCVQCDKVFTHPLAYKTHLRYHKNGRPPHSCHICGKTLGSTASFRIHLRIHTGEKPFVCDVCGKRFKTKQHVKSHVRVHMKAHSHVCTLCHEVPCTRKCTSNINPVRSTGHTKFLVELSVHKHRSSNLDYEMSYQYSVITCESGTWSRSHLA
ncbi:hypothetical protein GWI33_008307 [Rhynchophorus ferrugineus]|uniref:C2H2-type domain-containing protein n=1 Tax=Rhynchophorus ferrugineus TaxID=354439 RepID=A0A834MNP5_RHYFE|nr:hypothetical protein GWI33_008307 [Rhynchophorus ferrugineus]